MLRQPSCYCASLNSNTTHNHRTSTLWAAIFSCAYFSWRFCWKKFSLNKHKLLLNSLHEFVQNRIKMNSWIWTWSLRPKRPARSKVARCFFGDSFGGRRRKNMFPSAPAEKIFSSFSSPCILSLSSALALALALSWKSKSMRVFLCLSLCLSLCVWVCVCETRAESRALFFLSRVEEKNFSLRFSSLRIFAAQNFRFVFVQEKFSPAFCLHEIFPAQKRRQKYEGKIFACKNTQRKFSPLFCACVFFSAYFCKRKFSLRIFLCKIFPAYFSLRIFVQKRKIFTARKRKKKNEAKKRSQSEKFFICWKRSIFFLQRKFFV